MPLTLFVSADRVTVCSGSGKVSTEALTGSGGAAAIASVLQEYRTVGRLRRRPVAGVVLLPDVCEVRAITTPPLSTHRAAQFVKAQAAAIFLKRGVLATACTALPGSRRTRWLAAAAPVGVVEEVLHGAAAAGIRVHWITPVQQYAANAARAQGVRTGSHVVEMPLAGWSGHITLHRGRLIGLRRSPAPGSDPGAPLRIERARHRQPGRGSINLMAASTAGPRATSRLMLAACIAGIAVASHITARNRTMSELNAVADARALLAEAVAAAARQHADASRDFQRLNSFHSMHTGDSRVAAVLGALARGIDDATVLSRIDVRGDTVRIEGITTDAPHLLDRLSRAPELQSPKFIRALQRLDGEGEPAQLFALEAVLND